MFPKNKKLGDPEVLSSFSLHSMGENHLESTNKPEICKVNKATLFSKEE